MRHDRSWSFGLAGILIVGGTIGLTPPLLAQIVPDSTLGPESSSLKANQTVRGLPADLIQGGAVRGVNLFHSFLDFNVSAGQRVYFANPGGVVNIFSRVTGQAPSNILGTLGVDGSASLFLLNPNGILFGPNARLDIGGSFVATTASRFSFADGSEFSATRPQSAPLLTVNLRPGLQYGPAPGPITNSGSLSAGQDLILAGGNLTLSGAVQAGRDLSLQALDTVRVRDSVTLPFIASAGGQLQVQGNQQVDIFALNHPSSGFYAGEDLVLRSTNPIAGDAHYFAGGNFRIEQLNGNLGNLFSPYDPVIRASGDVAFAAYQGASLHIFAGGSVIIPGYVWIQAADPVNGLADSVVLADGSVIPINGRIEPTLDIRAGTTAVTPAGAIPNPVAGLLPLPGIAIAGTTPPRRADIVLGTVFFVNAAFDPVNGGGAPLAGRVLLTNRYQPNPNLTGDIVVAKSLGGLLANRAIVNGDFTGGGTIDLHSSGSILIDGIVNADPAQFSGTINGNGGDITLRALGDITLTPGSLLNSTGLLGGNIRLDSGGTISTTAANGLGGVKSISQGTSSGLKGGNVVLQAQAIVLSNGANLQTDTTGAVDSGDILLQAQTMTVTGGSEVLARTFSSGKAGNIVATIPGMLTVAGVAPFTQLDAEGNPDGGFSSGFFVSTENLPTPIGGTPAPAATGAGGNLIITAGSVNLTDGGVLSARSKSQGNGGNVEVTASTLNLLRGGQIVAPTYGTGSAGNIVVNAQSITMDGVDPTYAARFKQIQDAFVTNLGLSLEKARDRTQTTVDPIGNLSAMATADLFGLGKAGSVTIRTQSMSVTGGAEITTQTFGAQRGGDIRVAPLDTTQLSIVTIAGVAPFTGLDALGQPSGGFSSGLIANSEDGASGTGGSIFVDGIDTLRLSQGGVLSARSRGSGDGGAIGINVKTLELTSGGQILTVAYGTGNAGAILAVASEKTTIAGFDPIFEARFQQIQQSFLNAGLSPADAFQATRFLVDPFTAASGLVADVGPEATANAGSIALFTPALSMRDSGVISTSTFGQGNAGNILVQTNGGAITLDNSTIFSTVESGAQGKGGNIFIGSGTLELTNGGGLQTLLRGPSEDGQRAGAQGTAGVIVVQADRVSLLGTGSTGTVQTGIFTRIEPGADGDSGNNEFAGNIFSDALNNSTASVTGAIFIAANQLSLTNGAILDASTLGKGNAGAVVVQAQGAVSLTEGSAILSRVGEQAEGNAGGIVVRAGSVAVSGENTGMTTQTNGLGDAGLILIATDGDISLSGQNSGIFSSVELGSTNTGGGIGIATRDLLLSDGAQISVNNQGEGTAGDIGIQGRSLRLNRQAEITATTRSGQGGNLNLKIDQFILLRRNSQISTTAGLAPGGGDGGNMVIDVPFVIAIPSRDSNITAQAYTGKGGSIEISAQRLFDIDRRPVSPKTNDISASSTFGINGVVQINTSSIDPSRGLTPLPINLVDPSNQIDQGCRPARAAREPGKFVVVGRGGLPPNPRGVLSPESVVPQWGMLEADRTPTAAPPAVPKTSQASGTIVEAQGWATAADGSVTLVAQAPTPVLHPSWQVPVQCGKP